MGPDLNIQLLLDQIESPIGDRLEKRFNRTYVQVTDCQKTTEELRRCLSKHTETDASIEARLAVMEKIMYGVLVSVIASTLLAFGGFILKVIQFTD